MAAAAPPISPFRLWARQSFAASGAGAAAGALRGYLTAAGTGPTAALASTYAANTFVFAGAAFALRSALLASPLAAAPTPPTMAASAVAFAGVGGLLTGAVSGWRKGAMGAVMWGCVGCAGQSGVDEFESWAAEERPKLLAARALQSRLTAREYEAWELATRRADSAELLRGREVRLPTPEQASERARAGPIARPPTLAAWVSACEAARGVTVRTLPAVVTPVGAASAAPTQQPAAAPWWNAWLPVSVDGGQKQITALETRLREVDELLGQSAAQTEELLREVKREAKLGRR